MHALQYETRHVQRLRSKLSYPVQDVWILFGTTRSREPAIYQITGNMRLGYCTNVLRPDLGQTHAAALSWFHYNSTSTLKSVIYCATLRGKHRLSFVPFSYFLPRVPHSPTCLHHPKSPFLTNIRTPSRCHWAQHKLLYLLRGTHPSLQCPQPSLARCKTPPRLASSSSYHAILISTPIPEVPREHMAETSVPAKVPQRVASPSFRTPTSVSTHGGGEGARNERSHSITPLQKAMCVSKML